MLFFSLGSGSSRIKLPFLCANLGLQLGSNPWLHVLGIGRASSNGVASCSFNAPAVASPFRLLFQAVSASTCSNPVQSTVVTATLTR